MEALGAGNSIGSRAQEVEDSGSVNAVQVALEDLQTHVDHLTSLSVMSGKSLSMLAEMVVENRVEEDALQVRQVNQILSLETSLGKCDWSVSEVPANFWQAIRDLQDEMSQKATERDLEDILELIQDDSSSKPTQGSGVQSGVQFHTPIRVNPEATYMEPVDSIPSGRVVACPELSRNQDLNLIAHGATIAPKRL